MIEMTLPSRHRIRNSTPGGRPGTDDEEVRSEEGPNTDFSYFDCFNKRGLHCIHLNAPSFLPKIHELRHIVQKTSASIIGITESWLDSTISDSEINIPGYIVVRQDRNREGGGEEFVFL